MGSKGALRLVHGKILVAYLKNHIQSNQLKLGKKYTQAIAYHMTYLELPYCLFYVNN